MTATALSGRKLHGLRRAALGLLAAFFLLATGFLTPNSTRPVAAATATASPVPTSWSATLIPAASDAYPGVSISYGSINNHALAIEDYYDLNFDPISDVLDLTNPESPSRLTYDGIPAALDSNPLTDYGLSQILNDNQTLVGSFGESNPATAYEPLDPQSFSYSCQLSDCAGTFVVYPDPYTYSDPANAIAYSNLPYINNNGEATGADGVFTPPDTIANTPFIANENPTLGTAQNLTSALPCANNATPLVLNDNGVVGGTLSNDNAFIWTPPAAKCTVLAPPSSEPNPGKITLAVTSINNNGLAAVTACDNTLSLSCRGYLYSFNTSQYVALSDASLPLTIPGQNESFANGITAANVATLALNDAAWILVDYYYPDSNGDQAASGAVLIPNNSPTPTPSASPSPSFTPTAAPTATATNVAPTPTPAVTPAPTPTGSPVPSATASSTPSPLSTPTTAATPTPITTPSASATPQSTPTPAPTSSPAPSATPTPISTPVPPRLGFSGSILRA